MSLKAELQNMLDSPQLMSFATVSEDGKPWVRYVVGKANRDLEIRFATFANSRKVAHVKRMDEVHLTCGANSPESVEPYLQIQGKARIEDSEAERNAIWHDGLLEYFSGPDDPNLVICVVTPYRIELNIGEMNPTIWES